MSRKHGGFRQRLRLVEVFWIDCLLFTGGWETPADLHRQRRRIQQRSVGYVMRDDKLGIMLTGSLSQNGHVFGTLNIPRRQIEKVRRLDR